MRINELSVEDGAVEEEMDGDRRGEKTEPKPPFGSRDVKEVTG